MSAGAKEWIYCDTQHKAGLLELQVGLYPGLHRFCRGNGQYLALPRPRLQVRRRYLPYPLPYFCGHHRLHRRHRGDVLRPGHPFRPRGCLRRRHQAALRHRQARTPAGPHSGAGLPGPGHRLLGGHRLDLQIHRRRPHRYPVRPTGCGGLQQPLRRGVLRQHSVADCGHGRHHRHHGIRHRTRH